MPAISTGLALGLAGLSALGTMGATAGQMFYNKAEAQRNRNFQEHMRDTSLESMVNQATRLGISPSLVLGGSNTSLGGSQASVSGNRSGMGTGVNQFIDYLKHENQLKTMEEINEDKIEAQKYIAHEKMSNSVNSKQSYQSRKYSKEYLDSLYDDLSNVNLFE